MQGKQNITYVKKASGRDMSRVIGAIAYPAGAFFLCVLTIWVFKNFGKALIAPASAAMWGVGTIAALFMPSMRKSIINETCTMIIIYCCTMLGLRELISVTSGASSQMLMATFGQSMTTAMANTIPGFLQNALYASSALIPASFIAMQGKRILTFRRNASKNKMFERLRRQR